MPAPLASGVAARAAAPSPQEDTRPTSSPTPVAGTGGLSTHGCLLPIEAVAAAADSTPLICAALPSVSLPTTGDGPISSPSAIMMTVAGGDGCGFFPPTGPAASPVSFNKNSNSFVEIVDARMSCGPAEDAYSRFRYFNNGSNGVAGNLLLATTW